ncbi:hypothetical protein POM88_006192 [Heracleum sosnowskyi]|uniref:RNase H type-1 domain-containing protein n=1 Tax=Heracleum sosnowskyi TaxID=360622 RepID=A0AAD8J3W0_9APIA|nr:hypothetical protein POM88_006192 [Heracleum sosnowskyi]
MTLWGIWFARNHKVWEGKIINPSTVVEISMKQKHDWQEAMKSKQLKTAALSMKPAEMQRRIRTLNGNLRGKGGILRNEYGQFVQGKNMRFQGRVTVLEAEARGVEEGIRWIEELGVHNVEIERNNCESNV